MLEIGNQYDIIVLSDEASKSDERKGEWDVEVMKDMGMTDKQFNGFVRFVLDDIKEVLEGMEESKEKEKLEKVADNLQKTLED